MWRLNKHEKDIFYEVVSSCKQIINRKLSALPGIPTIEEVIFRDEISYQEISEIYKSLPEEVEFYRFMECLKPNLNIGSRAEPSSDYKDRITRLKAEQANREYREMTKSINRNTNDRLSIGKEIKEVNKQMIVVINTILTVCGAFAFGYFGIHLAHPHAGYDIATRVMVGLVLATIVFFADLYFIIKSLD